MSNRFLCKDSDDEFIRTLSELLTAKGIEGADAYMEEEGHLFFALPYPIVEEGSPIPWSLFIDVEDGEYRLNGFFSHSHFATAEEVAAQLELLYEKRLAEVGLALPTFGMRASFYVDNTGDPEKNIAAVSENAQAICDLIVEMRNLPASSHRYYAASSILSKDRMIHISPISEAESDYVGEANAPYMTSCVLGEMPEVYFIG